MSASLPAILMGMRRPRKLAVFIRFFFFALLLGFAGVQNASNACPPRLSLEELLRDFQTYRRNDRRIRHNHSIWTQRNGRIGRDQNFPLNRSSVFSPIQ